MLVKQLGCDYFLSFFVCFLQDLTDGPNASAALCQWYHVGATVLPGPTWTARTFPVSPEKLGFGITYCPTEEDSGAAPMTCCCIMPLPVWRSCCVARGIFESRQGWARSGPKVSFHLRFGALARSVAHDGRAPPRICPSQDWRTSL